MCISPPTPEQVRLWQARVGVRKIRWTRGNKGKSGGVRIIYFNSSSKVTLLLTLYSKNERETIPAHELKRIKEAIDDD
ncbi:MAG: type II toxin-antitoxin system RelE/ParE family toxin [Porticoccaceae bacterium]|nr:type II toxin-antitoxin system RelE/ParE family toxin [Porticoccaceae bacterium]